jgi:hypothetical protein
MKKYVMIWASHNSTKIQSKWNNKIEWVTWLPWCIVVTSLTHENFMKKEYWLN